MNEENKKKVWKLIQKTGDELKGFEALTAS